MLKNRAFILAAIIASATPAFAAPVAMSTARHADREVPVIEHRTAPTASAATVPVTIAVKSGFALAPHSGVFGFGVHTAAAGTRFGFAPAGEIATKLGFSSAQ